MQNDVAYFTYHTCFCSLSFVFLRSSKSVFYHSEWILSATEGASSWYYKYCMSWLMWKIGKRFVFKSNLTLIRSLISFVINVGVGKKDALFWKEMLCTMLFSENKMGATALLWDSGFKHSHRCNLCFFFCKHLIITLTKRKSLHCIFTNILSINHWMFELCWLFVLCFHCSPFKTANLGELIQVVFFPPNVNSYSVSSFYLSVNFFAWQTVHPYLYIWTEREIGERVFCFFSVDLYFFWDLGNTTIIIQTCLVNTIYVQMFIHWRLQY